MTRRAIPFLFAAFTALTLSNTACKGDKGGKAEAGKADAGKADDGKAEAGDTTGGDTTGGDTEAAAEAGETAAGTDGAGETAGDTGEAEAGDTGDTGGDEETAAAAEDDGDDDDGDDGDDGGSKGDDGGSKGDGGGSKDDGGKTAAGPKLDGKPIFLKKCKSCHGVDGKGDTTIGKKVDIESLANTKLSKAKIIKTVTNGIPDTKMKAYKDKLSKDEIEAVAAYVKKL